MTNFQIIKEDAIKQRAEARKEVDQWTVRSRGVWIFATYKGDVVEGTEGETYDVDLTAKCIKERIEDIIERNVKDDMDLSLVRFQLFGGWDAADSLYAMNVLREYEPCASEWDGTVEFDHKLNLIPTQGEEERQKLDELDDIVERNSGFKSFNGLLNALGDYRPTIDVSVPEKKYLADEYDAAQAERGDERRAFRRGGPLHP